MKLCIPVLESNGLDSLINPHLPSAEFLLFFDTESRHCTTLSLREQQAATEDELRIDAVLCGSINRVTLRSLVDQGIMVYGTAAETVVQAIAQFEGGELVAAEVAAGSCAGHGHAHAAGACGGHGQAAGSGHQCQGQGGCGGAGHKHTHDHEHAHEGICGCSHGAVQDAVPEKARGEVYQIAVSSQNRKTVTEHAGKCRKFWIFDIQHGQVTAKNLLELPIEETLHSATAGQPHPLDEVSVLITAGMGGGLQQRLKQRGILGVVTAQTNLDLAVADFLAGKVEPFAARSCSGQCSSAA